MRNKRMARRNLGIVALLIAGLLVFALVEGVVLPRVDQREELYAQEQLSPLTHDIARTGKFKTKYMGNASKVSGLFRSLPLGPIRSFALDPDTFTVQVNLEASLPESDGSRDSAMLYGATAAFAYIGNLETVIFNDDQRAYKVTREELQQWYGFGALANLTEDSSVWNQEVQSKLANREYVRQAIERLFHETAALAV
ncbi:DUF4825 domain-containing protein [Paenibacillus macerans]|uniref:DUF4825 domain-containing protein n=1 Tax=Paenibacillus macerans TaxID=44252 RepID=UPI003D310CC2